MHAPMVPVGRRRALVLQWATIAWNALEVIVAVALGLAAHSLALVAFAMDSLVEIFASVVVVWHMAPAPNRSDHRRGRALRLVSAAFVALAVSLFAGAMHAVLTEQRPDSSPWGMAYLAVTALVMFTLGRLKRTVGETLDDDPLRAEASMSVLDGCLALGILGSLAAVAMLGWWWADPAAAGLIALVALFEARQTWRSHDS